MSFFGGTASFDWDCSVSVAPVRGAGVGESDEEMTGSEEDEVSEVTVRARLRDFSSFLVAGLSATSSESDLRAGSKLQYFSRAL